MMWAIINYSIILVTLAVLLAVWIIYVVFQVESVANYWKERVPWPLIRKKCCCQTDVEVPTNSIELEQLDTVINNSDNSIHSEASSTNCSTAGSQDNDIHPIDIDKRSIANSQVTEESGDTGSMDECEGNEINGASLLDKKPLDVTNGSIGQSQDNEETASTSRKSESTDIENSFTDESQRNEETEQTSPKFKQSYDDNTFTSETETKSPIVAKHDASNNTVPDGTFAGADNSYKTGSDSLWTRPIQCQDARP